ncbi:MAG TPA: MMPL family transporter [Thermomicrobiales bacterium]
MFARWGFSLYRNRKLALALSGLGLVASIVLMVAVGGSLSSSGFANDHAESARVDRQLADEFGRGRTSIVFIFDAGRPVSDPAVRAGVEAALAPLAHDQRVVQVLTTWSTGNPRFVSNDGQSTYAVALLNASDDEAQKGLDGWRDDVAAAAKPAGLTVTVAGDPAIGEEITTQVEKGIARAETATVPLTLLVQVVIFGSLVAAGLPLLVGALAIVGSVAAVLLLANFGQQSVVAINVVTGLGLALGVDYSLFMVARFREELRRRPVDEALSVTMATVGKSIFFSGITVIFGLSATHFFPLPALHSMGDAGMIVVALALVYGLTFLPAMLGVLGDRINAVPIGRRVGGQAGRRAEESRQTTDDGRQGTQSSVLSPGYPLGSSSGFWHGVATAVMRRPVAVLVPLLVVLLLAGVPFLRLDLTPGGPDVLPTGNPARDATERLRTDFPAGESDPVPVIVTAKDGNALSAASIQALRGFVARAATVPHVTRIESVVTDAAAAGVNWDAYDGDPATLPTGLQPVIGERVRGDATLVEIVADAESAKLQQVVRDLRTIDPTELRVEVGGPAATDVDTVDGINAGIVPALVFVIAGSYLILLLTFGSVFLPLKAIAMTLLSITASLGTLVLVFQDGRLEGLLGFQATGQIISTTPILMFCILFGLSMDYEVLMLTRVQEEYERTGDNTAAVAVGLERTAKTITGAAAIMIIAFGGFLLADIVVIKSLGFGLALAVLIDATIVRALLVPATMRLMGRWNWWAPSSVRALVDRLGLARSEVARAGIGAAD